MMIKNIFKIFKDDLRATLKNPIVLIVLAALVILPSLYSVLNIDACWDPYNNTDQMDYIIVNNDNPITLNGTTYNYGQEVVDSLKNDTNFNWVYKDEDEARDSLKNGSNVAAIIIPNDFSEDILSINTATPKQAQLEYINNEKLTPVGVKITQNAAEKVNTKINNEIHQKVGMQLYSSTTSAQAMQQQPVTNTTGVNTSVSQQTSMQKAQDYFHSPVELTNSSYYTSESFGDELTPFYTTLSIWVGCIILVALLSQNPVNDEDKYEPLEEYFGKMGLFLLLVTLQTCVTFIGLCLLGVTMNNSFLLFISMLITSLACVIIVYSLVSVFGNVGKALSIIILVFQISGTNGIYPIEVVSHLFQLIYPYLPLTYGISLLREALSGLLISNYLISLVCLLIFPIITVILSVVLKEKLYKRSRYFEEKLRDSNLFQMK